MVSFAMIMPNVMTFGMPLGCLGWGLVTGGTNPLVRGLEPSAPLPDLQ